MPGPIKTKRIKVIRLTGTSLQLEHDYARPQGLPGGGCPASDSGQETADIALGESRPSMDAMREISSPAQATRLPLSFPHEKRGRSPSPASSTASAAAPDVEEPVFTMDVDQEKPTPSSGKDAAPPAPPRRIRLRFPADCPLASTAQKYEWYMGLLRQHPDTEPLFKEGRNAPFITLVDGPVSAKLTSDHHILSHQNSIHFRAVSFATLRS